MEALNKLGEQLGSAKGPARRYTPKDADIDTVIETLTVFATPHQHIQKIDLSLPSILVPERKPYGVRAYDTLYSDEPSHHDGDGRAYEGYGVDPKKGCVIITRPDQHVSGIYAMDDYEGISEFVWIMSGCGDTLMSGLSLTRFARHPQPRPASHHLLPQTRTSPASCCRLSERGCSTFTTREPSRRARATPSYDWNARCLRQESLLPCCCRRRVTAHGFSHDL